jgi:hypothetical protein
MTPERREKLFCGLAGAAVATMLWALLILAWVH